MKIRPLARSTSRQSMWQSSWARGPARIRVAIIARRSELRQYGSMKIKLHRPSPAMVAAMIALFASLGGSALAVPVVLKAPSAQALGVI